MKNDYIHYFHENGISRFYKRENAIELFKRKDLIYSNGIIYTLETPQGRKINNHVPKRLLVLFTCMPNKENFDNHIISNRMFPKFFDGIQKSLVKNVYIMRIMDINCSHGSHYTNTINYSNFEKNIQKEIDNVVEKLTINKRDVVLYGASKGGTGALLHGSALDYKTLAVDPILHLGEYNAKNDLHFLKDLRKEDVVEQINKQLKVCGNSIKYIICSENVVFNYNQVMRLNNKVNIINLKDDMITAHPEVSRNSVPEQLMYINMLFTNNLI
ncbi:accessory Sec system protein Asp2 [Acinetobacter sp. LoGeW2-3]|uniref:accessory Sec system protein Asp2 n=1 Tax=Acinetobacter sp. LoGeW2-3 TaxID=1808001 RepID=UPI001BC87532|nr:accessory Sec system protein Asp2 [Acinetobacter sp. LoGeW2-3]